jgi:metallo-beta-lactamase family protein
VELYDEETQTFLKRNGSPLEFSSLTYTRSVDESKAINEKRGPLVIISASGMCESGRILHHLRNNIGNPRNTILIVSWQAENTLGRRPTTLGKQIGDVPVRAQVATINGYSGHAGTPAGALGQG